VRVAAGERVDVLRARHDLVDAALEAAELDRRRAGGLLAGGIAFRAFIWLLPAALLATGVLGLVYRVSPKTPQSVAVHSGLGGVVANAVGTASNQSQRATVVLIVLGAGLTVYTAMTLVRSLRVAFVLAWGLPLVRGRRLLADSIWFSAALIAQLALGGAASWVREQTAVGGVVVGLVVSLVGAALWLWISWRLPHAEIPWTALIPGSVMVCAGLVGMHLATVYYFAGHLEHAGRLYGSLGVAATLLLWLYLVARLIVGGAFLNATLWYRKHPASEPHAF
jgi:uncharacterized BrkB/YihY/UPF0761 family membrane protein